MQIFSAGDVGGMDKRTAITDDPLVVTALLGAARSVQRKHSVPELPPHGAR